MKILMPQLGETVTEGTISAWHKKVGDEVEKDESLLDVETDKVATEIPSPVTGILRQILVAEDETVDVGTILAVIGDEDEMTDDAVAPEPGEAGDTPASSSAAVVERNSAKLKAGSMLSPAVRRLVSSHQLDINSITGTGRSGRIRKQDVLAVIEKQAGGDSSAGSDANTNRIPFDRIRRVTAEHMVQSKATSPHVLQAIDVDFQAVDTVRSAQRESWRAQHGYSLSYLPFIAKAVCRALEEFPKLNSSVVD